MAELRSRLSHYSLGGSSRTPQAIALVVLEVMLW
jgi:hypothetical protein